MFCGFRRVEALVPASRHILFELSNGMGGTFMEHLDMRVSVNAIAACCSIRRVRQPEEYTPATGGRSRIGSAGPGSRRLISRAAR